MPKPCDLMLHSAETCPHYSRMNERMKDVERLFSTGDEILRRGHEACFVRYFHKGKGKFSSNSVKSEVKKGNSYYPVRPGVLSL